LGRCRRPPEAIRAPRAHGGPSPPFSLGWLRRHASLSSSRRRLLALSHSSRRRSSASLAFLLCLRSRSRSARRSVTGPSVPAGPPAPTPAAAALYPSRLRRLRRSPRFCNYKLQVHHAADRRGAIRLDYPLVAIVEGEACLALVKQLEVYREDPDRHLRPLCATVAAVVLGVGGDEVREEVEKGLEEAQG
jgi:hypothetical protein